MLVLYRRAGEGLVIKNAITGHTHDLDFMYNKPPYSFYMLNGERIRKPEKDCFYIDDDYEIMIIVVEAGKAVRIGIDAPDHWDIARKESLNLTA